VAWRRTTVNGRHGLPEEIKHLQNVRLRNCEQPRGLQSREIELQKAGQKKEDRIEDINAAAVVYMPITPNRDSNAREMPEMPEERAGEEERRLRKPCTVTAPAGVAGHRLGCGRPK
jgi:hypothetical protein